MEKVVEKFALDSEEARTADLRWWLTRPPDERVETVEILRRQYYGEEYPARLPRVAQVVERERG